MRYCAFKLSVQAGVQQDYVVDSRNINIRKWSFLEQESINDASVVGLDLKNTFDHFLAASTYGGYDTWYTIKLLLIMIFLLFNLLLLHMAYLKYIHSFRHFNVIAIILNSDMYKFEICCK